MPDGDARDLMGAAGSAILCRAGDVDELERAVDEAFDLVERGGRMPEPAPAVLAGIERRALTAQLADVFEKSLAPTRRSATRMSALEPS